MSAAAASPRAAVAPRLVVLLGALSTFGPLSIDLYLPGLPAMSRDLGASASAAQLTITAVLAGLAVGQLLAGPVSDARGRRRPLVAGVVLYAVASALCALAPGVWPLVAVRFAQGLAGAAGIAISRAVVRDLASGTEAARTFSLLILVNGAAPILAPVLGAQLLHVTDWRGVFGVLAGIGVVLAAAAAAGLPETLPAGRRHAGGLRETLASFAVLLRDRAFVVTVGAAGCAFAALFAYISGSSFVLQEVYGLSAQAFSAVFAANGLGIVAMGWVSRRLVEDRGPQRMLRSGTTLAAAGGAGLLVAVLAGAGLAVVLVALFAVVSSVGFVTPNAAALALEDHPEAAGAASGLLGLAQFAVGGAVAPLVGIAGAGTAVPMAVLIAAFALAGALFARAHHGPARPGAPAPAEPRESGLPH